LPQRLIKYSLVISIKESYLFVRNWLGLFFHPFKTVRAMFREKDYSQILLIFSFPLYIFAGGLAFIWFGRWLIKAPAGEWGLMTKGSVGLVLAVSGISFSYLGFWLWQVLKPRK
jgi:hypothetical protein